MVDIAAQKQDLSCSILNQVDTRATELLQLIRNYTPADKTSSLAVYLPGFTSLRLLLEKSQRSSREEDLIQTLIESFSSYSRSGKDPSDIACMVARDYMVLSRHQVQQQHQQQQPQQQEQQTQQQQQPTQQFDQHYQHSFDTGLSPALHGINGFPPLLHGANGINANTTESYSLQGAQNSLHLQNQQFFNNNVSSAQNTFSLAFSQVGQQAFDF